MGPEDALRANCYFANGPHTLAHSHMMRTCSLQDAITEFGRLFLVWDTEWRRAGRAAKGSVGRRPVPGYLFAQLSFSCSADCPQAATPTQNTNALKHAQCTATVHVVPPSSVPHNCSRDAKRRTSDLRPNGKNAPARLGTLFRCTRAGLAGLGLERDEVVLWGSKRENTARGVARCTHQADLAKVAPTVRGLHVQQECQIVRRARTV